MGHLNFLKPVLGDELYEQVEAKLKDNKDVNLANLASGEYVSKAKYDDDIKARDAKISELTDSVKKFDGVDIDSLKNQVTEWQKKYDKDISETKLNSAIQLAVAKANPIDSKALMPYIDKSIIKFDQEGNLVGLNEQIEKAKKDQSFLFAENNGGGTKPKQVNLGGQHTNSTESEEAELRGAFGLKAK